MTVLDLTVLDLMTMLAQCDMSAAVSVSITAPIAEATLYIGRRTDPPTYYQIVRVYRHANLRWEKLAP